jgi:hypothetical protein
MSFDWFKRFREGHKDLEDDPRNGWSWTAQNTETVAKVCELVTREHWVAPKLMDDHLHINQETNCQIIHENLGNMKSCTKSQGWAKGSESQCLRQLYWDLSEQCTLSQLHVCWRWVLDISVQSWTKTSEHGVIDEIITESPKTMLVKFEVWKYVDHFFNKQGVCGKEFVMEGEPVNSEFCIQVPERLLKLISREKPQFQEGSSSFCTMLLSILSW